MNELEQLRRRVRELEAERKSPVLGGSATPDENALVELEAFLGSVLDEIADEPATTAVGKPPAIPDRAGGPAGLGRCRTRLAAIRDVLQDREHRVAELRSEKEEVLSLVAHDLRSPLVAIHGFAQLLSRTGDRDTLTSKQTEYIHRILQAVGAMNRLVEDLLTARHLDQGTLPFRPRQTDVPRFLDDLLAVHREVARQKEVSIRTDIPPDVPAVAFDPDRLGQALGNLVQNAVRFTPSGKVVRVSVGVEEEWLEFAVCDQGPGIDAALLPRLFEKGSRGRITETAGAGYGLGLAICREIAVLHGGSVRAENLPAGGSRFRLGIPLGRPGTPPDPADVES